MFFDMYFDFGNLKLFVFYFILFSTEVSAVQVHQAPAALLKPPREEVQITCNHSNPDFYMIQWYKQSFHKRTMALVGYVRYSLTAVEESFKSIYNVSGDGRSLSSLQIADSKEFADHAVYFCAVSKARCHKFSLS
uniref:Ig-like domain-containing protein n=1 Tax=Gouania willdenowi TaxID=441366 RepID=A0A8C5DJC9_GOUWI